MVSALLAVLTAVAPPATPPVARMDNPPIRVSLNSDGYFERGDRARVRVRTERDGYVVVLRADVDGRVRVLFPLDPGDDNFVRGGDDYTLAGRGDRKTFIVDNDTGDGTILAAFSLEPFEYDQFVRGDHWDYRVLASDRMRDDPEAGLLDLVTAMAGEAHFDYDVVGYTVASHLAYRGYYGAPCFGCGYGYSGFGLRIGLGFGRSYYRYGLTYCDPWYDSFYCDPFFRFPAYGFGFYSPYYYYGYRYRPYPCFNDPFCYGGGRVAFAPRRTYGGLTFKWPVDRPPRIEPRRRAPGATTAGRVEPRSRVSGSRGDWGTTTTKRAEPRRRSPPPPAARPARPRSNPGRSARPRTREHSKGKRSGRSDLRPAIPFTQRGREAGRGRVERLPVDVSPGRTPRLLDQRRWNERLPVDVSPGRGRRVDVGRSLLPSWGSRSPQRSSARAGGWSLPRSGGIRFSVPSLRRSFGGGLTRQAPRVSRPAPRRR